MKKRYLALLLAIIISMAAVLAAGAYGKYAVLAPLGLEKGLKLPEIPFALLADDGLKMRIELARELKNEPPTEAPTEPPTEPPTQAPTEPPTEAPTEADTQPETEPPTEAPTQAPTEPPTEPPATEPAGNTGFGPPEHRPVPNPDVTPVDDEWFSDALFIGDSRTEGLRDYARVDGADYFCDVGMSVFNIYGKSLSDWRFSNMSIKELLSSVKYGKVYINLGVNEAGYGMEELIRAYSKLLDLIREKEPEAIIIIQAIMTTGRREAAIRPYSAPEKLFAINKRLEELADNVNVFYIDVNELVAGEDGYLPEDLSGDGCHLYAKKHPMWMDWIRAASADVWEKYKLAHGLTEPTDATEPTDTTEPTDNTEPTDATEPATAENPSEATSPTEPSIPTEPVTTEPTTQNESPPDASDGLLP